MNRRQQYKAQAFLRSSEFAATSIASETGNPALMERFRMPDGNGDTRLIAKARAFATAIRELSPNDELEAHGHSADTAADLEEVAAELEGRPGQ